MVEAIPRAVGNKRIAGIELIKEQNHFSRQEVNLVWNPHIWDIKIVKEGLLQGWVDEILLARWR